jgi:Tfp pilus assembly protein PilN
MSAPNQLSFLPDDYLARKAQRRANLICATLFIVAAGAIGAVFMVSERATRAVLARHEEIDTRYTEAAKGIEQVREMQDKQQKMVHQAELTASLLEKVPRSYLLAEFTNSLPGGVSLIDFTLESRVKQAPPPPPKSAFDQKKAELEAAAAANAAAGKAAKSATPAPPQPKLYDVYLKLSGVAQTDVQVAQFIAKLNRSKLLTDVNLLQVDQYIVDQDKVRKFQLEMMLNPTASVDPSKDEKKTTAALELGTPAAGK